MAKTKYERSQEEHKVQRDQQSQKERTAEYSPGRLAGFFLFDIVSAERRDAFIASLKGLPDEDGFGMNWMRNLEIPTADGPLVGGSAWANAGMLVRPEPGKKGHIMYATRNDLPAGIDGVSVKLGSMQDGSLFVAYGFRVEEPSEPAFKEGFVHADDHDLVIARDDRSIKMSSLTPRRRTLLDDADQITASVDWVARHLPSQLLKEGRWRDSAPVMPVVVMGDAATSYMFGREPELERYLCGHPLPGCFSDGKYLVMQLKARLGSTGGPSRGFVVATSWAHALDEKGDFHSWHVMYELESQVLDWLPGLYSYYFVSSLLEIELPETQSLAEKSRRDFRACISPETGLVAIRKLGAAARQYRLSAITHQQVLATQQSQAVFERRVSIERACRPLSHLVQTDGDGTESLARGLAEHVTTLAEESKARLTLLDNQLSADMDFAKGSIEARLAVANWWVAILALVVAVAAALFAGFALLGGHQGLPGGNVTGLP